MMDYFMEKVDEERDQLLQSSSKPQETRKRFWTFQRFISFVEIIDDPSLLGGILINYSLNNQLNHHQELYIYSLCYFSAILSVKLAHLNRAYTLLRKVILEALDESRYDALEFVFTTLLDYKFVLEVLQDCGSGREPLIKKMISNLYHCLENCHLSLIKKFKDNSLLLKFLSKKKIYRKLGNFFSRKGKTIIGGL